MIEDAARYLASPLAFCLWLMAAGLALLLMRWRRAAAGIAITAFVLLWICATPWVANMLASELESRYTALTPEAAPSGDAIVVLGGAIAGAQPPGKPTLALGNASTRVWYAAQLYRAGKAKVIVVAAGNRPEHAHRQVEADAIAEFLVQLGVPREAILLERVSQTTRQNAEGVRPVLDRLGARRVLLVTSALHMPRAMQTFVTIWAGSGPQIVPLVTDVRGTDQYQSSAKAWLPSLEALNIVSAASKEFAGMAVLAIISSHR